MGILEQTAPLAALSGVQVTQIRGTKTPRTYIHIADKHVKTQHNVVLCIMQQCSNVSHVFYSAMQHIVRCSLYIVQCTAFSTMYHMVQCSLQCIKCNVSSSACSAYSACSACSACSTCNAYSALQCMQIMQCSVVQCRVVQCLCLIHI